MNNQFTKKEAPIQGFAGMGGGAFSRLLTSAASGGNRSLRFNPADSPTLSKTFASAGDRRTWTFSCWVKRTTTFNTYRHTLASGNGFTLSFSESAQGGPDEWFFYVDGTPYLLSNAKLRDTSAWYHAVFVFDTTNSTEADRCRVYQNGERVTDWRNTAYPSQNYEGSVNTAITHKIGCGNANEFLDGYMTDVYFIDGLALDPTSFGATDSNGVWQRSTYSGSYGTNGFHILDFANDATIGNDTSGNGNHFTASNFSETAGSGNDVLFDFPTNDTENTDSGAGGEVLGNYATWSSLVQQRSGSVTLSNGNLDTTCGSTRTSTMSPFPLKGKTYWEVTFGSGANNTVGMTEATGFNTLANDNSGLKYVGYQSYSYGWNLTEGILYNASNNLSSSPGAVSNGNVVGWAYDADNNTLKLYKNGVLQHTQTGIADAQYFPAITHSDNGATASVNFGQREFAYAAPSGYKALCTTSLPTPGIADGSDYFDIDLYTGTGSTHERSEFSFSPDLVWIKQRNTTRNNLIFDTIRGANKFAVTNSSGVPGTGTGMVTSFDSDGFTLGNSADVNQSSGTFCAWCWDAGSSTVSNTDGNFTTNVRANTSSGFSIVQAPSMTVGTKTLGHGLGATPDMIWIKRASGGTEDWYVFHSALGTGKQMRLNQTNAFESTTSFGTVNSTVFSYDPNTGDHIAFCFKAIESYSAFGTYEGNNDANGPFIPLSFRPAFFFVKNADATQPWNIYDSSRDIDNVVTKGLQPNNNNAEYSTTDRCDFLSNGIKIKSTGGTVPNLSGNTYIWAAFAENPFQANGGIAR